MASPAAFLLQDPRGAVHGVAGDSARALGDTLGAAVGMLRDTVTASPLPGGVAEVVRFIFSVPQSVQIGGVVVAALVGLWVVWFLWQRREPLLAWLRTRNREIQIGLAAVALIAVTIAGLAGMKTWNYMQHDNGFCTGCHVMEKPFTRFQAGAGKHETLQCHDCHQQSIFASTRQLVLWVANRPEEIGKHAPVQNSRCESCHNKDGRGTKQWEHVYTLAGHRVHFESDSSSVKGLQCVKCHGQEVHKFIPSARTCQQSGCHENKDIKLGTMANLPEVNCALCHSFRKDLPPLATRDSARLALVPAKAQCTSCHQMAAKIPGYRVERDPHNGTCGSCHDVHAHITPQDARGTCIDCHKSLEKSPFHDGPSHKAVKAQCLTCHTPHAASVDASNCVGCHNEVRRRSGLRPPVPFDTMSVLRKRVSASHAAVPAPPPIAEPEPPRGKGDVPPEEDPPPGGLAVLPLLRPAVALADTFPHSRHTSLACITCHTLSGDGGKLAFEVPRGCDLCHHQALIAGRVVERECASCHRVERKVAVRSLSVTVRGSAHPPRPRDVRFAHASHTTVRCADCHRPPDAIPVDSVLRCQGCHVPHHAAGRECATCHGAVTSAPAVRAVHERQSHARCDKCHAPAVIAELLPNRAFCVTCHETQRAHKPNGECSTCHFLESPDGYRAHLRAPAPSGS